MNRLLAATLFALTVCNSASYADDVNSENAAPGTTTPNGSVNRTTPLPEPAKDTTKAGTTSNSSNSNFVLPTTSTNSKKSQSLGTSFTKDLNKESNAAAARTK